jgi:hypothetical protein
MSNKIMRRDAYHMEVTWYVNYIVHTELFSQQRSLLSGLI